MPTVRFEPGGAAIEVPRGTLLIDAIRAAGLPIARACGDDLICARCGVRVLEGRVSREKAVEQRAKQRNRIPPELRLACAVRVNRDLTVSADYWGERGMPGSGPGPDRGPPRAGGAGGGAASPPGGPGGAGAGPPSRAGRADPADPLIRPPDPGMVRARCPPTRRRPGSMARINDHYLKLAAGYLFPEIGRRVRLYQERHPGARIIRLGIGDVVLPLSASVRQAMHRAVDELGTEAGFRGYGPEQGYAFLREAIAEHEFRSRGAEISPEEIFVSDGSKCDSANIQEIFAAGARVAVPDPVYPVYVDTNVMAGRTGPPDEDGRYRGIVYLPCNPGNGFLPAPPDTPVDLVYLCSPNNPTGAAVDRKALAGWVAWAREHGAVLLFDAAYEAFITDERIPHSIFEIPGAREVAIEFRSFSKKAGFTGLRCAYVVVPEELRGTDAGGEEVSIRALWSRRHGTKFNGASYPVQAGARAIYTDQGKAEIRAGIDYTLGNARIIREGLAALGLEVHGGRNAPYVWVEAPEGLSSWELFDRLLGQAHVVGTPGSGFGAEGEGFLRLSAFGKRDQVEEAVDRIRTRVRF